MSNSEPGAESSRSEGTARVRVCVHVRVCEMQGQGSEAATRGRRGPSLPRGQWKGDSGKHGLKGKPSIYCEKAE